VINAVWISTSDPVEFFRNPVRSGSGWITIRKPDHVQHCCAYNSDNVTRLESRFLVTRTRLESRWERWWIESTRVTFFTECLVSSHNQWLNTRVRVIFTKSLSLWSWWANPVRLDTKKWAYFAWVMFKIGANFLFPLSSRAILPFKDQVYQLAQR